MRRVATPEEQDQKLKDVAKLYEKQFLREMTKAMRSTVSEDGFIKANQAEKIFREQLDQEYVEKWGDKGGIGLADMIYKQLLDKLGPGMGIKSAPQRPMGPIQLDQKNAGMTAIKTSERSPIKIQVQPGTEVKPQRLTVQYDLQMAALQKDDGNPREVLAPWDGNLLGTQQINPDEYLLEMSHTNGRKSQLVFRGQIDSQLSAQPLKEIQAGQRLGLLSPEAKNLFWTVE